VFILLGVAIASGAIWLWQQGIISVNDVPKNDAEANQLEALQQLHDENNRLQAEIVELNQDLEDKIAAQETSEPQIAGAKTESPSTESTSGSGLVNINSADSALLETLPGIGPSKAGSIIEYRTVNGGFKTKEEIMSVKGIGEKTFEKLKDLITL
jgi:comEA protein